MQNVNSYKKRWQWSDNNESGKDLERRPLGVVGQGEGAEPTGGATAQGQQRTRREMKFSFCCLCPPLVWVTLGIRSQRFVSLPKWVKRKGAGTLAPNSHKQPSLTFKRTEYYYHYWLLSPFPSRIHSPTPTRKKCTYHQADSFLSKYYV